MPEFVTISDFGTETLIMLSVILLSGFFVTRITNRLQLPKVSGYILAGILIGPCGLRLVSEELAASMSFISDIALAFIAFGVGKFFKKEVLLHGGKAVLIITVCEALTSGLFVTLSLKILFHLNWDFALLLGAIATATAPASTMMTIRQYKARGPFVNMLLQIVALDDVVCLLSFSIVSAFISGKAEAAFNLKNLLVPILCICLSVLLGILCGILLSIFLKIHHSKDTRLILTVSLLLGISGICALLNVSPLLACMTFGAVYINMTRDKKLFRQVNNFTPPVMSLFFIVSGISLNVELLLSIGIIGVCYFFIRIIGKYAGTYVSCAILKTSPEIRNYMGLALIPQAGVAIGLAFLGQRTLPADAGNLLLTIILSSSVLYEMVGPVSAKTALKLSGSITVSKECHEADAKRHVRKKSGLI